MIRAFKNSPLPTGRNLGCRAPGARYANDPGEKHRVLPFENLSANQENGFFADGCRTRS